VSETRAAGARFRAAFGSLRRNATIAGTAIAATFGAATALAVKSATTYEKSLAEISTLVDSTRGEIAAMGDAQRELAVEFGTDIASQLKGTYDAISAGVTDVANATEHMRVVNKAATAGITDTATAGEGLIRVMSAYSKQGTTAAQASDLLFTIVRKGVTTFKELAPNVGRLASVAAAAGVSMEEMGAALATATKTASTPEAIVQVAQLISAIVKPGVQAAKAADKLGLEFGAVALSTKGLLGVMDDLREKIGASTAKELARLSAEGAETSVIFDRMAAATGLNVEQVAQLFPNVRALRGALALMANDGRTVADNLEAMKEATGATDAAFAKIERTGAKSFDKLKATITDLRIEIGQALAPAVLGLVERIRPAVRSVIAWVKANPKLAGTIASVVVGITAAAAAAAALGFALTGIGAVVGVVTSAFALLSAGLAVFTGLPLLILAPLALVAAGVAAVVIDFVDRVGGIRNAWDIVSAAVIATARSVVDWFRANWPRIREVVVGVISTAWTLIRPIVHAIASVTKEIVGGLISYIQNNWPLISDTFNAVWKLVRFAWENIGQPVWDEVERAAQATFDAVTKALRGFGKIIGGLLKVAMGAITGDWKASWDGIKDIATGTFDIIESAWDLMWSGIKSIASRSGDILSDIWEFIWGGIKSSFQTIVDGIVSIFQGAWETITGLVQSIVTAGNSVASFLGGGGLGFSLPGFQFGGLVGGRPGVDRNIAALSRGEFIVNSDATAAFLPLLEAINAMPSGGRSGSAPATGSAGDVLRFGDVRLELPGIDALDQRGVSRLSNELARLGSSRTARTNRRTLR